MAGTMVSSWALLFVCTLPVGLIRSSPARIVTSSQPPGTATVTGGTSVTSNLVSEYPKIAPFDVRSPSEAIRRMREMLGRVEPDDSKGLKRVFLSKDNVTCNDGSPAGFYIRKSQGSRKWIIFLEGGWYCYDQRSCQNRWLRLRNFMTSKQWTETRNVGGILSQNPEENPYWWNANHIFVPYCSSDSWSGTRSQPHKWHHHPEGTVKYAFMGAYIVQEVIKDLLPLGLAEATTLILAGSSAGGTGVIVNLDRVADSLAELGHTNIEVRGLADSGWFLDNTPYSSGSSTSSSAFASSWLVTSPAQAVKKGVELWRGKVPERCHRDYPNEAWRCYFGYRVYPTLKAPLFVFQWLFDEAQMTADNVGAPVTKEQWDYIHQTGDNLRKTFENVTGLFAASCISHTVLTKRDWQAIRLGDATLPQALHCWEMHHLRKRKGKGPHQIDQTGEPNHHHKHHGHHSHGHMAYMGSSRREGMSRNADVTANTDLNQAAAQLRGENVTVEVIWKQDDHPKDPVLTYAGDKEISMSTWNPLIFTTRGENTTMLGDAPISSTLKYSKNTKSGIHKPQLSSPSSSMAPSNPVDSTPASVNFSRQSISRKLRGGSGRESELMGREGMESKVGRDGKHRRKGKRKRRKRRRRKKKRGREEEEMEEQKRESEREERKHRRGGGNRGGRRGEGHRGRRKNAGHGGSRVRRSELSNEKLERIRGEEVSESNIRGRRRGGGHCSYRLMERCTWPQCNHSCPKLHNPFTGEEMDFIELLKSFGLDMTSVANALGIDIHTLNNMDHDELLNLLTQQSN